MTKFLSSIVYVAGRVRIAFICFGAICLINSSKSFGQQGLHIQNGLILVLGVALVLIQVYLWVWRFKSRGAVSTAKPGPIDLEKRCEMIGRNLLAARLIVLGNLATLKASGEKEVMLEQIPTEEILRQFHYKMGEQSVSLVLGIFDETYFKPVITEKILNMQGQVGYLNALPAITRLQKEYVAGILQDIAVALTFLGATLFYLHIKYRARSSGELDAEAQAIFEGYVDFVKANLQPVAEASWDLDRLNASIKVLPLKDYGSVEYDLGEGSRSVIGYTLPKEIAEQYIIAVATGKTRPA